MRDVFDRIPEPERRATFGDEGFARWFWECWTASVLAPHLYDGRSIGHHIVREKGRVEDARRGVE